MIKIKWFNTLKIFKERKRQLQELNYKLKKCSQGKVKFEELNL